MKKIKSIEKDCHLSILIFIISLLKKKTIKLTFSIKDFWTGVANMRHDINVPRSRKSTYMNLVVTELRPHEGQQRQQQLTAVGQQQQASC